MNGVSEVPLSTDIEAAEAPANDFVEVEEGGDDLVSPPDEETLGISADVLADVRGDEELGPRPSGRRTC